MPGKIYLNSFDDVVDVIGGLEEIAQVLNVTHPTVSAWRTRTGLFPAQHFFVISRELRQWNCDVVDALFDFDGHRERPLRTARRRWSEEQRRAVIDGQKRLTAKQRRRR
jgi:hypothetical protein